MTAAADSDSERVDTWTVVLHVDGGADSEGRHVDGGADSERVDTWTVVQTQRRSTRGRWSYLDHLIYARREERALGRKAQVCDGLAVTVHRSEACAVLPVPYFDDVIHGA